jgi:hypothetical protein
MRKAQYDFTSDKPIEQLLKEAENKGRRLERRALRLDYKSKKREGRMMLNDNAKAWIEDWLASRAKRKERANGK